MKNKDTRYMTQAAYADHAGVSKRTVIRWIQSGLISTVEGKGIDWIRADKARSTDPGYFTTGKLIADSPAESDIVKKAIRNAAEIPAANLPDILESKTRREYAEAQIAEMKSARMKNELVEVAALEKHLFLIFKSCRDALLNVPARVSEECAALTDKTAIHAKLTKEITSVLENLSDEINQCSNSIGADAT